MALLQTFADQAVIAIQNARLFRETQEALEHQTATSEVLNVIAASVDDAQPVFDKIIDSAAQLFPNALALMILQTDAQDMLHVAGIRFVGDASGPFTPDAARQREQAIAQSFPSPLAGTATELAIRTGLADIPDMHNATDVPGLQRFANIIGFNFAALFAPLMWEGKGIGSIAVLSAKLGPFDDKQRALIKTFADQAVIAIQNAKMFRETNEALERQTATAEILKVIASSPDDVQPVFEAIANSSNRLIGGFSTAVFRVFDEQLHLVAFTPTNPAADDALKASFPRPLVDVPTAAPLREGAVVRITDTEDEAQTGPVVRDLARLRGYRSMLFCPLLRGGQLIGMISVTRREPGPFAPHLVELLQTFADQAVIAIENVRLFNETKEALEQQKASADVLEVISGSMGDAAPVFEAILVRFEQLIADADGSSVTLIEEDGMARVGYFRLAEGARRNFPSAVEPDAIEQQMRQSRPFALEGSATELAIRTRRSLTYLDAMNDPSAPDDVRKAARRISGGRWSFSLAVVPLLKDGVGLGAISVSREVNRAFSAKELGLLEMFADQAVVALENARLFNDTQRALERQTATAEVLKVIASSPGDVQPVFDVIARSSNRLAGAFSTVVTVRRDDMLHLAAFTTTDPEGVDRLKSHVPTARFGRQRIRPRGARRQAAADRRHRSRGGPVARPARACPGTGHPQPVVLPLDARACGHWRDQRVAQGTGGIFAAPGGAAADLCRPGGDRDRERAAVQRDQGGAGAADRHGGCAERHQQLGIRHRAGVRGDRAELPAPVRPALGRHCADRRRRTGAHAMPSREVTTSECRRDHHGAVFPRRCARRSTAMRSTSGRCCTIRTCCNGPAGPETHCADRPNSWATSPC